MLCGQYNNEEDNRLTKIKSLENGVEGKKNIKFNLKFKFKKKRKSTATSSYGISHSNSRLYKEVRPGKEFI